VYGTITCESDIPKKCFSTTFLAEDRKAMDYFNCKTCKINCKIACAVFLPFISVESHLLPLELNAVSQHISVIEFSDLNKQVDTIKICQTDSCM